MMGEKLRLNFSVLVKKINSFKMTIIKNKVPFEGKPKIR